MMSWDIGFTLKNKPVVDCRWKFINENLNLKSTEWIFFLHGMRVVKSLPELEKMIKRFETKCEVHLEVKYADFSETRLIATIDDTSKQFLTLWQNEILPKMRLIAKTCPKSKIRWRVYEVFLE